MQKLSISIKWAFVIVIVVLGVLVGGLIINKVFFYSYFLAQEKAEIFEYAEQINDVYHETPDLLNDTIDEFLLKKGISITILNPESSFQGMNTNFSMMLGKGRQSDRQTIVQFPSQYQDEMNVLGYTFFTIRPDRFNINILVLGYKLSETDTLMITLPFDSINTTADIAMMFNFIVSLALLLLAVIIVFIVSKKMTKPIVELSTITQKIANLDFEEKFISNSKDEIGELGNNINSMSIALERSLLELQVANEKLLDDIKEKEKNVEMRKSLIANISHELKTPIALIMSYSEGLKDNFDLDEDKKKYYLNVISKETNHMDQLVRDLLNLSELEFDAFQMKKVSMDLSSLIDEIMDRYILMISKKQLKITMDKEDILMMQGDKKRLEQALTNLIVNGIEHADDNGQMVIRVKDLPESYQIEIENTGSHIPENMLEMIWNSFYKSDDNQERRIGGSGIGLSIVRAVIDKHAGTYKAENIKNGVRFTIELKK